MARRRHSVSQGSVRGWGLGLWLLLIPATTLAGEPGDTSARAIAGNDAYERGDYLAAIEIYRGILDEGLESASLCYNLGNAYLKAGQLGWAILSYERALRLAPRDGDVQANLAYARSRMVDVLPEPKSPWIVSILVEAHGLLAPRQLAWLSTGLWFAVAVLAIVGVFRASLKGPVRTANIVLVSVLALALASLGLKIYDLEARHAGIVVAEEVQVMSGPGTDYAREFILHAGTRVTIERAYQGWLEVGLSEEMRGWVEGGAVDEI